MTNTVQYSTPGTGIMKRQILQTLLITVGGCDDLCRKMLSNLIGEKLAQ